MPTTRTSVMTSNDQHVAFDRAWMPAMRAVMHRVFRLSVAACATTGFLTVASAQDQAGIEAGETLYDEHCAMCHGEKLRTSGAIPDLRELRADQRGYFNETV